LGPIIILQRRRYRLSHAIANALEANGIGLIWNGHVLTFFLKAAELIFRPYGQEINACQTMIAAIKTYKVTFRAASMLGDVKLIDLTHRSMWSTCPS